MTKIIARQTGTAGKKIFVKTAIDMAAKKRNNDQKELASKYEKNSR